MSAKLIKGTEIREQILEEITAEVAEIKEKHGVVPGLVTILVGENPASISYVTLKIQTAHRVGFHEIQDSQPVDLSEEALLGLIDKYNKDDAIHGILVQLPLPKHVDEKKVLNAIDPDKDVDGFHPVNVGRLMIGGSEVKFPPCTPAGIQEMIVRAGVETKGCGRRTFKYCRQTYRKYDAPEGRRRELYRNDCSHGYQRSGFTLPACGYSDCGCRRSGIGKTGVDQAGCLRYRCRGQQDRGKDQ